MKPRALKRYRKKNDIQYEFMYFHYINDQKKYATKTVSEKKFLNYYAVKNDVHDVKGIVSRRPQTRDSLDGQSWTSF